MTRPLIFAGLAALLILALAVGAYRLGHGQAAAEGRAEINALKAAQAEEARRAADAYAKAVADALERYKNEVARADALALDLQPQDKDHARHAESLRDEIKRLAARDRNLDPDTVRLLNRAAGAGDSIPDAALPPTLRAPGPAGKPAAGAAADAGLLAGVSEADLVAWFTDYAARSRRMETRLSSWQRWYRELMPPAAGALPRTPPGEMISPGPSQLGSDDTYQQGSTPAPQSPVRCRPGE
ncbi:MAG: hypothetical protein LBH65_06530 [Desulfovibrio sp.]|jgi:hypothetical protein|nr:hypothetical protein [Desulfovibrio sp.]